MPNPDPAPDVTIPKELIAKLIEAAPSDLQKPLLDALNNAAFINRDDPIFGLVLFLELLSRYYTRTANQVITSGRESDERNREMTALLDERVRILQGLEKGMQEAASRLDTADKRIVEAFPVNDMAAKIADLFEREVKRLLPMSETQKILIDVSADMVKTTSQAHETAVVVANTVGILKGTATKLTNLRLPGLLSWTTVLGMVAGAAITAGVGWFFVVQPMKEERPSMRQMANLLRNENFIGQWVTAGYQDGRPVLIISKDDIDTQGTNAQGDVTIWLKKK